MKRDVKVGLFVAGVVCCVAALLLGGGVVGRPKTSPAPLSLSPREDAPGILPAELAEALLPPADGSCRSRAEGSWQLPRRRGLRVASNLSPFFPNHKAGTSYLSFAEPLKVAIRRKLHG